MWKRNFPAIALLVCACGLMGLMLPGCGLFSPAEVSSVKDLEAALHPKEEAKAADTPKKAAGGAKNAAGGGEPFAPEKAIASIKGVATFTGAAPKISIIKMSEDCAAHHAGAAKQPAKEDIIVNDGKLANVIVYVSDGFNRYNFDNFSLPAAHINQQGCMYLPHVLAMMTDQKLEIESSDPVAHNIHGSPNNNSGFNVTQASKGIMPTKPTFSAPEMGIPVRCDVHSWMSAWICVFEHPFFAVSKEDGSFEIKLPPGKYELSAWHETGNKLIAPKPQKVEVAADKPAEVKFNFSAK